MAKELFTAIVVSKVPGCSQPQFAKYRNIPKDDEKRLYNFVRKTFPNVSHINFYEKATKRFRVQVKAADIVNCYVGHL